jgi:alpha-N-arabinofuranosidase
MNKYDPKKKIGLMVDEWGNWFNVEPGTNPGFLYQQNTLRDAITAGSTLNIFNNNADRVRMGNIAQMISVLQVVILTDRSKMIFRPTYHIFAMYKVHQDAILLPTDFKCAEYKLDDKSVPELNISSSKSRDGKIHISIVNLNPQSPVNLNCEIRGQIISSVTRKNEI